MTDTQLATDATVVMAVVTSVAAVATLAIAVATWRQARATADQVRLAQSQARTTAEQLELARFSVGLDALLKLDADFTGEQMLKVRHEAAVTLVNGAAHVVGSHGERRVDQVLDIVDTAGYLVKRGGIELDGVYHMFYDPIVCYWFAAKVYVDEVAAAGDAQVWKYLREIVPELLKLKARDEGQTIAEVTPQENDWKAFLQEELAA